MNFYWKPSLKKLNKSQYWWGFRRGPDLKRNRKKERGRERKGGGRERGRKDISSIPLEVQKQIEGKKIKYEDKNRVGERGYNSEPMILLNLNPKLGNTELGQTPSHAKVGMNRCSIFPLKFWHDFRSKNKNKNRN